MAAIVGVFALVVLLPLALNEFGELAPWMAKRLLRLGARLLGSADEIDRYAEEWSADLEEVPGKLTKLTYAVGVLAWSVPRLRWQYRRRENRQAVPLPVVPLQEWQLVKDWTSYAVCKGADPDELFGRRTAQNRAKQMCRGCPVRTQCLTDAVDNGIEFGVWGGMTDRERRALLRRPPE